MVGRVQDSSRNQRSRSKESPRVEPGSTPPSSVYPPRFCSFPLVSLSSFRQPYSTQWRIVTWKLQPCIYLSLGSPKADPKARVWVHCSTGEMISRSIMREWGSETKEDSSHMDVWMSSYSWSGAQSHWEASEGMCGEHLRLSTWSKEAETWIYLPAPFLHCLRVALGMGAL